MERNRLIDKVYYENHKEDIKLKKHEWYINNRERILKKQKEYRENKKNKKNIDIE
mgnify:CR=1 FL=1|tara:strand:- start:104 stop:268 length:165 start_codon:yes stop_codon:yes gene_type:complete